MKSPKIALLAALLALPLATMAGSAVAANSGHGPAHEVHGTMALNHGQKWASDAPLRQGMGALHDVVSTSLADARSGRMSAARYDQFSDSVMTQFAYIVENCKLDVAADAQLHILLANIAEGVAITQGKAADQDREAGLARIAEALNSYGTYFAHPGWSTIDITH